MCDVFLSIQFTLRSKICLRRRGRKWERSLFDSLSVAVNHVLVSNKGVSLSIIYYLSTKFPFDFSRRRSKKEKERDFIREKRCCSFPSSFLGEDEHPDKRTSCHVGFHSCFPASSSHSQPFVFLSLFCPFTPDFSPVASSSFWHYIQLNLVSFKCFLIPQTHLYSQDKNKKEKIR